MGTKVELYSKDFATLQVGELSLDNTYKRKRLNKFSQEGSPEMFWKNKSIRNILEAEFNLITFVAKGIWGRQMREKDFISLIKRKKNSHKVRKLLNLEKDWVPSYENIVFYRFDKYQSQYPVQSVLLLAFCKKVAEFGNKHFP
jgi:hypothetical protein